MSFNSNQGNSNYLFELFVLLIIIVTLAVIQ